MNTVWADGRSGALIFRVRLPISDASTNDVDVISLIGFSGSSVDLAADIREYYLPRTDPALVVVLETKSAVAGEPNAIGTPVVMNALPVDFDGDPEFVQRQSPVVISIDHQGDPSANRNLLEDDLLARRFSSTLHLVQWLVGEGLSLLLHESDAVHRGDSTFHYRTPAGSHQDQFVVVGEAFHNLARASFAALGIWISTRGMVPREILVDTGSISAVGFAYALLARSFDPTAPQPGIRSFRGHGGQQRTEIEHWRQRDGALFVISASASGSLHNSIASDDDGSPSATSVSLFFLGGSGLSPSDALCNLEAHPGVTGPERIQRTRAFAERCELCEAGSALVEITGDSLFPASPVTTPRKIVLNDRPAWLIADGQHLFTRGLWRFGEDAPSPRPLRIELGLGLDRDDFRSTLLARLRPPSGYRPDLIVTATDPDSRKLSAAWIEHNDFASVPVVTKDELPHLATDRVREVAVISSVIASGRTAIELSRALRLHAGQAATTFVVGLVRVPTSARTDDLKKDLSVWRGTTRKDPIVGFYCPLPGDRDALLDAWGFEIGVWEQVLDHIEKHDNLSVVADAIRDRIAGITDPSSRSFLPRGNALPNSVGSSVALRLSDGFAFWHRDWTDTEGFAYEKATHADVYATVAALLNHARTERTESLSRALPLLRVDAHNRVVIDPFTFSRFSDGVVQAAILRAASDRELDYSSSRVLSRDVSFVIEEAVTAGVDNGGEAITEFLVALVGGRLKLRPDDRSRLLSAIHRCAPHYGAGSGVIQILAEVGRSKMTVAQDDPHQTR